MPRNVEPCDVCGVRPADVQYRMLRPADCFQWFCSRCAASILWDAPARDFARLETPLNRLHELVSVA